MTIPTYAVRLWSPSLPSRLALTGALNDVRTATRYRFPAFFRVLRDDLKQIPLHGMSDELMKRFANSEALVTTYLQVGVDVADGLGLFSPSPTAQFATDAFGHSVWSIFAPVFDASEDRLLAGLWDDLTTGPAAYLDYLHVRSNDLVETVRLLRLLFVSTVVQHLPFATFWDEVDGDGGYVLSELTAKLADWLEASGHIAAASSLIQPGSAWDSAGLSGLANSVMDAVKNVSVNVLKWQNSAQDGSRMVDDIGAKVPYALSSIKGGAGLQAAGTSPEIMFARPALINLLRRIKTYWERVLPHLPKIASSYHFAVNAASLSHGGRHPPHIEHRNGTVADVDLQPNFPVVKQRPASGDYHIGGKSWQEATDLFVTATAFTGCIYLTFPSKMLYASEAVNLEAMQRLIDGFEVAILAELAESQPDSQRVALLEAMRDRIGRMNPAWGTTPKAEESRRIHANHWHVAYHPSSLGAEEAIPVSNVNEAKEFTRFQAAVDDPALWSLILSELVKPFVL